MTLKAIEGGQRSTDAAAEMCDEVKEVIYSFADRVPVALAIGVLQIAAYEILRDQE